ncbi:hypothetical protein GCM10023354_20990 [Garicola koreensis]|uniref:hypothetical protein n=1 Tax=Garicola koreensis TaxID=1262554 RepID=UPI0031E7EAE3
MENLWPYFEVLAPSVGVGLIFWFAMRAIFRADRNERAAETQIRDEYAQAQPPSETPTGTGSDAEETRAADSNSPNSTAS